MPRPEPLARPARGFLAVLAWSAAILVTIPFLWLVGDLVWHGFPELSWLFLTQPPSDAGRGGGIGPILVSTGLLVVVCMAVALPIGLGAAVFLAEFTNSESLFGRLVRRSLDVLAAVPSIIFGLFGNLFFCKILGLGFSLLSGGLTLACMVLPILICSIEQGFRAVPDDHRRGAAALGLTRSATLFHLLLPAATPGLVVGLVLGIGRALAETAALIFTSGYVDRMPGSLFDSGRSISVHIYDLAMNVPGGTARGYASALVLLVALLVINALATLLGEHWLGRRVLSP